MRLERIFCCLILLPLPGQPAQKGRDSQFLKSSTPNPAPITAHAQCTVENSASKTCHLRLWVQPAGSALFSLDGEPLKANFSRTEKTLALVELSLKNRPLNEQTTTLLVMDKRTGGARPITVVESAGAEQSIPLVYIDPPQSRHRFVARYATGKQPKSAMFISERQVILPLLDDSHIDAIDILTGKRQRLEVPKEYAKRGGFVESVRVPSRNEFWVSQMKAAVIHRFAADTLEYRGTIPLSGAWTKVLAYDARRNLVYASNWNSADISVVSVESLREIKKIKLGKVPRGMAFSADGNTMVAAMFGGKSDTDQAGGTALVDLNTQRITRTIIWGGAHRHAVRLKNGHDVFAVSDMAKSRVYFIENYAKVAETKVFSNPNTIVESPDGKYLYVSCRGHNNPKSFLLKGPDFGKIIVIDSATRKVVEEIEGGNQPTGLDVSPDGKYIVSTDFLDHALRLYERAD